MHFAEHHFFKEMSKNVKANDLPFVCLITFMLRVLNLHPCTETMRNSFSSP